MQIKESLKPYAKALIEQLKSMGATNATLEFDGSGDSGSIYSVTVEGAPDIARTVKWLRFESEYSDGKWIKKQSEVTLNIQDALEALCYDMLESTNIDWYNNDGGYGSLVINFDPLSIELEVNTRYTEVNTDSFELQEI